MHYLLEGYNGTIFAYGQTGSGKTHSIMGSAADPGVVPRCAIELMKLCGNLQSNDGSTWVVKASYLQVYREVLRPLLSEWMLLLLLQLGLRVLDPTEIVHYLNGFPKLVAASKLSNVRGDSKQLKMLARLTAMSKKEA